MQLAISGKEGTEILPIIFMRKPWYHGLVEKMKDRNDAACQEALSAIRSVRLAILADATQNPSGLIVSLCEQQGELRFDASNRLFLVLVDTQNF